jgi:hypothetical protein
MRSESRGVATVTHVADIQQAVWVTKMKSCLEIIGVDHPGPQVVSDQDDMGSFLDADLGILREHEGQDTCQKHTSR